VNIYERESGNVLSSPSRFLDDISEEFIEKFVLAEESDQSEESIYLPPEIEKKLLN
jgi:hypothetical protein